MLIHASRRALIAIGIALLSYLASVMITYGMFGLECGTFGLDCVLYGAMALFVGCGIGLYFAVASFNEPDTQPGLKWVSLVLNFVPMLLDAWCSIMLFG